MALAERASERKASPADRRSAWGWVGATALLTAVVLAWFLPWNLTPYGATRSANAAFNGAGRAVLEQGINRYWNGAWRDPGQALGPLTVVGGRVYAPLADGQGIEAVSAQNGRMIWRDRLVGVKASAPVVANGRVFVIADDGGRVDALSPRSGGIVWSRAVPGRGASAEAFLPSGLSRSSVRSRPRVLAVARGGRLWLFAARDGAPLGARRTLSGLLNPRLLVTPKRLYVWGAAGLEAWAAAPSPRRRWSAALAGIPGSLVVGPDGVYVAENGRREAIAAYSPASGRLLWRSGLGTSLGGVLSPLVYYRGAIYFGTTGSDLIYDLGARHGHIRWETEIAPDGVAAAPLPVQGALLVADNAGIMWDLDRATGYTVFARKIPGPAGRMRPYLVGHSVYLDTVGPKAGLYAMHVGMLAPELSGWTKPL